MADLRADVDRDGRVDVSGASDSAGEDGWSTGRGALYLPNVDDDTRRCPVTGPGGSPLSDAELASCNDASDAKVNGRADAADLARVRSVPMTDVASGAKGAVRVTAGARHTRVFLKRSGAWVPVTPRVEVPERRRIEEGRQRGEPLPRLGLPMGRQVLVV